MSLQRLVEGAAQLGLSLTEVQGQKLLAYGALMLEWNKVYNLTALRDAESVLTHHLLDSMALVSPLLRAWPSKVSVLDVGSGAGLPGVVVATLCPLADVVCVDAVAKKSAFVQEMAARLNIGNLTGRHARVEAMTGQYDVITSRAFSSLADFYALTDQLLAPHGQWVAMKGRLPVDEIARIPAHVEVFHVEPLVVPGLDAERCLVWARRSVA